jgi:sugar/nucleoside kinase (ribokinase family)
MAIFAYGSFVLDTTYGVGTFDAQSQATPIHWTLRNAGGSAGNTLRSITAIGGNAFAVGTVGTDCAGNELVAALRSAKVNVTYLRTHPAAITKEVLTLVDISTTVHTFYFRDGNPASYDARTDIELSAADVMVLDEATPAGKALAQNARARGAKILLNLGWCKHEPSSLIESASIVIVSEGYLVARYEGLPAEAAIERLAAVPRAGPLVVTLGRRGIFAIDGSLRISRPAIPTEVVSTVGAGDAFTAGFALALEAGLPLEKALTLSLSFAARVCGKRDSALGPEDYDPMQEELRMLRKREVSSTTKSEE